jgi:NAD-dependent DNA ligase
VADLNRQIEGLKTQNQALAAGEAVNDQTIQKVTKNLTDKIAAADKAALAAQGRVDQISKERDEALKKAGEEKDRSLREKDEKIAATLNDLESKNLEVQQRQQEINRLLEVIRGLKPQIKAGELVMRKPDGKVARVFADSQMCYINLGERDHAVVGLPFSVYGAQAGIPEDGKPKGKVLVVSVGPSTSECRLVESSREDPILEGDLVANVAYSPTRTHNFVVEGDFDLYGEGKPDPLGARRVSSLIEASGGKVQEEVSVGTDFVVMGDEPARPPKPPEDAPPATWQIYNDRMKTYDHYRQVRALATSLQIPVLNTTRFLAFTGFVPKKRLTE